MRRTRVAKPLGTPLKVWGGWQLDGIKYSFSIEAKFNFAVFESGSSIQKHVFVAGDFHCKFDGRVKRVGKRDKVFKVISAFRPLHLNIINETQPTEGLKGRLAK
jgi:hypothetical protein